MTLRKEIEKRAHWFEGQGDNVWMVTIRMDEITAAVRAFIRNRKPKHVRKRKNRNRR